MFFEKDQNLLFLVDLCSQYNNNAIDAKTFFQHLAQNKKLPDLILLSEKNTAIETTIYSEEMEDYWLSFLENNERILEKGLNIKRKATNFKDQPNIHPFDFLRGYYCYHRALDCYDQSNTHSQAMLEWCYEGLHWYSYHSLHMLTITAQRLFYNMTLPQKGSFISNTSNDFTNLMQLYHNKEWQQSWGAPLHLLMARINYDIYSYYNKTVLSLFNQQRTTTQEYANCLAARREAIANILENLYGVQFGEPHCSAALYNACSGLGVGHILSNIIQHYPSLITQDASLTAIIKFWQENFVQPIFQNKTANVITTAKIKAKTTANLLYEGCAFTEGLHSADQEQQIRVTPMSM